MYEEIFLLGNSNDSYWQASNSNEGAGVMTLGADNIPLSYKTAVRFAGIPVNQGVTISSAKLRLWVGGNINTGSGGIKFVCNGIKQTNVASFTSQPFGLPQTTNQVSATKGVPNVGTTFDIDVSAILNEIFAQSGWANGNAVGFVIADNGSNANNYIEDDYLHSQLEIHFSATPNLFPTPITIPAPVFPASSNYGMRVSQPGVDVRSATEAQLFFTSRKKELRVSQQGQTTATTIPHGLSYAPCVLGYYTDASDRHLINYSWNVFQAGAAIFSDTTNVYISYINTDPSFYYVFIDPLT